MRTERDARAAAAKSLCYHAAEHSGAEVDPIDSSISAGISVARARLAVTALASRHARRFGTFLGVGALGALIANGGLVLLREGAHLSVYAAGALSVQAAIVVGFLLNDRLTWRGDKRRAVPLRAMLYEAVNLVGLGIYLVTLLVVHGLLGLHYLLGGICGSGTAALWNYAASHRMVFHRRAAAPSQDVAA